MSMDAFTFANTFCYVGFEDEGGGAAMLIEV